VIGLCRAMALSLVVVEVGKGGGECQECGESESCIIIIYGNFLNFAGCGLI
jgi:hypothetical protein